MSLGTTLATLAVGGAISLVAVFLTNRAAEKRERASRAALEELHKADREAAEQVHRENREADLQRERLSELRPIVDDAVRAMYDMWRALGAFTITQIRDQHGGDAYMTEEREPSVEEFLDAYSRLRDAHVRLLARLPWDDTLHAPVGSAFTAAASAWNAVVQAGSNPPTGEEADGLISFANQQAQVAYRELQDTARARFAPGGLAGSQREAVLVLKIRGTKNQAERFLGPLRLARHNRVVGPDADGRVVVRDAESELGEARGRLEADLNALGNHWRQVLELEQPTPAK